LSFGDNDQIVLRNEAGDIVGSFGLFFGWDFGSGWEEEQG
jgi:hypothetical protein